MIGPLPRPAITMRDAIKTGHATFDRHANHPSYGYVGTGNVVSSVQASAYIRAFTDTECNGFTRPDGALQDFDLKPFLRLTPGYIVSTVRHHLKGQGGILYRFRHPTGPGEQTIHGYILTRTDHRLLRIWRTGPTRKSLDVLGAMSERVASYAPHEYCQAF